MKIVGIHYSNKEMLELQRQAVQEIYHENLLIATGGEFIKPDIKINPSKRLSGSHRYCDMVNQVLHAIPNGDLLILEADIIPIAYKDFTKVTWRNYLERPYPGILFRPDGKTLKDNPHLTKPFKGGEIDPRWELLPWRWEEGKAPTDTHIGHPEIIGEAFRHINGQEHPSIRKKKEQPLSQTAKCKKCDIESTECIVKAKLSNKACSAKRLIKKVSQGLIPCKKIYMP